VPFVNVIKGEQLPNAVFNVRTPILRIPWWAIICWQLVKGLPRLTVFLIRYWYLTGPAAALGWLYLKFGWLGPAGLAGTVVGVAASWWFAHRPSCLRFGWWPILARVRRWLYRRRWNAAMVTAKPAGTPDAFGWVNAVISELIPVAAVLTIKRRRRTGQPIGYPLFLLIAAASLSLAAQLAVAQPSPSGWLLSAIPALAFMALVKLVFTTAAPSPVPEAVDQAVTDPAVDREPAEPAPAIPARPVSVVPVPAEAFTRKAVA
jgi:hypothetical protein